MLKCKKSAKKFGGMKKSYYLCTRNSEMSCLEQVSSTASVAQLVRAPDC